MKWRLVIICSVFFLCSCKTLKNLSAKDDSYGSAKQNSAGANQQFLNDVSTTPGSGRKSSSEKTDAVKIEAVEKPNSVTAASLQIKYSNILGVPASHLNNTWLLQNIDYWMGTKYCMGGSTESCIDCSAFTQTVMQSVYHVHLPRTAQQQYDSSMKVEAGELQEGDLVFFHTSGREISHVGIYIANNKFAHASVSNGVMISDLNDGFWKPRYKGAGRVLSKG